MSNPTPIRRFILFSLSQVVLGSRLRTPVGEDEKELHRNSMRRELDSALRLAQMSHVTDTSLGNNESCESIETPVMGRRQVNHTEESEQRLQKQVTFHLITIRIISNVNSFNVSYNVCFHSICEYSSVFLECHKHVN